MIQHKSIFLIASSFYFMFKKTTRYKKIIKTQYFVFNNPKIQHLGLMKTILLFAQRSDQDFLKLWPNKALSQP